MTARLQKAIDFMKAAHRSIGQTRKDGVRPYEVHPLEVVERVSKVSQDEDVLIAALLHDVLEDVTPSGGVLTRAQMRDFGLDLEFIWKFDGEAILNLFGPRALLFVEELTDIYTKAAYPSLNRAARKQSERERYQTFSLEAKLIKLADIATNLNDDGEVLLASGGKEVGFNVMFIKEKARCLPYLVEAGDDRNVTLSVIALDILAAQAKKFRVRL